MLKSLKPLRHAEHGTLLLQAATDYGFARDLLMAPLALPELARAACEFPIVFPTKGHPVAALMGLEAGCNAYVAPSGKWMARHVPAFLRQYPFGMARLKPAADGSQRYTVLLDTESPLLSLDKGKPLFNADKSTTEVVASAMKLMDLFEKSLPLMQSTVAAMEEAGVLVERVIRLQGEGGKGRRVGGIRVVDEQKFNALKDKSFNALRKAGALPVVYAHLLSWSHFRQGPIGRAYPRAVQSDAGAAAAKPAKAASTS